MATGNKPGKGNFKKRAHRPWKSSLLENTVNEEEVEVLEPDFEIELDLNLDGDLADEFLPEFNFVADDNLNLDSVLGILETTSEIEIDELPQPFIPDVAHQELRSELNQTKLQQKNIAAKIHDKSTSPILLGGFFQPQNLTTQGDGVSRKMTSLLSDLKAREQKIHSLTSDIKVSAAMDRLEQAELNRRAESHARQAAEQRMRHAVEQANTAAEQFRTAMDQAKLAALAHKEEEELRMHAEEQAKEARLRANDAEIALQNERMARLAAEDKAQQALLKAEQIVLLQRQLQETLEQVSKLELAKKTEENRRLDLQHQFDLMSDSFSKIEQEHNHCSNTIRGLDHQIKDLEVNLNNTQHKIDELTAQRDKLKTIITTEQELRKLSERKMYEAVARAEKAEKEQQIAEQQLKIVDERAKRAVAHASRTVMHLLNAPTDKEYSMHMPLEATDDLPVPPPPPPTEKMKIKIPAITNELDYDEEDFKF